MDLNLIWLAGAIDCDGSVHLVSGGSNGAPCLRVQLYSSEWPIIWKAESTVRAAGLACSVSERLPRSDPRQAVRGTKMIYQLSVSTMAALDLHPLVRPHMVEPHKVVRWDAALEFFEQWPPPGKGGSCWSDEAKADWEMIRAATQP